MADSGDVEGVEDLELVEKSFFRLIRDEIIYPTLYRPFRRLDSFLWDNRHLFTLIGVFGAIAVYLRTVESEMSESLGKLGDVAVFSGLALVALLSLIVVVKLWIEVRRIGLWESLFLYVFASFFVPLIGVITGIISAFPQMLATYYFMIVYVLGFGTGLLLVLGVGWIGVKAQNLLNTDIPIAETVVLLIAAIAISIIISYTNLPNEPMVDPQVMGALGLSDWIYLYVTFALAIGGFFIILFFVLTLAATIVMIVVYFVLRLWSRINAMMGS